MVKEAVKLSLFVIFSGEAMPIFIESNSFTSGHRETIDEAIWEAVRIVESGKADRASVTINGEGLFFVDHNAYRYAVEVLTIQGHGKCVTRLRTNTEAFALYSARELLDTWDTIKVRVVDNEPESDTLESNEEEGE